MLQEQNVTAIYRRFVSADLVRATLREHGIEVARIHVIPDRTTGIDDMADFELYDTVIRDLELPEADTQTYQTAVRNGDFVVSATVPVSEVPRVEEIMRHPEAFADRVDDPRDYAPPVETEQTLADDRPLDPRSPARPLETTTPRGR